MKLPEWFLNENTVLIEEADRLLVQCRKWDHTKSQYVPAAQVLESYPFPSPSSSVESAEDGKDAKSSSGPQDSSKSPYYIDVFQWRELISILTGLLKLTTQPVADDLVSRRNNLILHYLGDDGTYLLDNVLQRLAAETGADIVVLDAVDISELACEPHNSKLSEDAADDRRMLGYDVYSPAKTPPQSDQTSGEQDEPEESDGEANQAEGGRHALSAIFLDVKGSSVDLHNSGLSHDRNTEGHGQKGPLGSFMQGLGGPLSRQRWDASSAAAARRQQLLPLIEAILAAPSVKRMTAKRTTPNTTSDPDIVHSSIRSNTMDQHEPALFLFIRDIRAIQRAPFGSRFLSLVYECVDSAQRKGQKIVIIGTETSPSASTYSANGIQALQSEPAGNISRTMVLTPVTPSVADQQLLREDKQKRHLEINMRHLWQMLCVKLGGLSDDVVQRDEFTAVKKLAPPEVTWSLGPGDDPFQPWSFDYVHRLASMIAGYVGLRQNGGLLNSLFRARRVATESDSARSAWAERQKTQRAKSRPDSAPLDTERLQKVRERLNKYERKLIGGVVEAAQIKTTFDQVYASLDTIDALKTLTTLSLSRPDAFRYGVLASDQIPGLLLYGPPGTGKTLLAKAVAKESGATVLTVSGAELNDMYVGEGEKNVKALFSLAKKLTPCVVFIDEADATFSTRGGGRQRVSHREMLNQFLREWDGMSNDAGSAFIMVATNRPFDLDDAVLRRLPRRLLVDLPTEHDRIEILKIHLQEESLADDVDLAKLASRTPFYSGSDLKNVCVAGALNSVLQENAKVKAHDGEAAFEYPKQRTLSAADFDKALEEISASISEDMSSLKAIKKFDEQYGDKKGRRRTSRKWGFHTPSADNMQADTVKVRD